jgi:uncharacterized repeat protein (TIGR01451 family)
MQAIWQNLSHLSATNAAGCDGVVHLQSSIDVNPVLGGRFGQVSDFGFEPEAEPARLTGSDAEVLGRCGSSDVLVAFPGFEAVDTGQTRVFTQNLRVFSGTNAASIASRKTLFENVLCWLHGCECSTFDVVLEAIGSAPEVNLGQSLTYTLLVSHSGECEATGAVVTDRIPSGLTYVNANSEQGAVEYDPATQTVTINLGHLAKASTTTIGIEVTAASPGPWTNWAAVRINGEQSTNNNSAVVLTLVGNAGSTMNLTKKEGQLQLQFTGAGTDTIVVQRSADLRTWEDWRTNLFGPAWSEPLVPDGPRRFFRTKE